MGQAAVAWIRNTAEKPERRPTDIGWLVVAAIGVAVVGVWAQSQSEIDANFFTPLNNLSSVDGVFKAVYALGSIWALGAVALVLLVFRQVGVALRVALAGALAWGVAELLHEILPAHSIAGVDINVRIGDGPVFPTTNVAIITALAVAFAPYAVRPLRRILFLVILLVAVAAMYLGAGYPSDALGGLLLGITAGAAVLVAFGSPAGRPTIDEVRASLTDLGYDVADLRRAENGVRTRVGDGRRRSPRARSCASTRSDATSATRSSSPRPGTGRCTTSRACRCSAAGSSRSNTSGTR